MTRTRTQSRGMCRNCGYIGTKASMTKHQAVCEARSSGSQGEHEVYRLRVSGSLRPQYWLDVDMPVNATLDDLDGFLRGIWLDCCGHLSEFTIGPQDDDNFDPFKPPRRGKPPTLNKLLSVGDKFGYTYDFGSSTELKVHVQARETVGGQAQEKVRLLARNLPPALACSECGVPAQWVHSWDDDEETDGLTFSCNKHGKRTRDEQLPVVNSPRMGMCGYEGGNDDTWPPADPGTAVEPARAPRKASPEQIGVSQMLKSGQRTEEAELRAFLQQALPQDNADDEDLLVEAQALPLKAEAVWIVAVQELPDVLPPEEGLASVVLVLDAASGRIVSSEVMTDAAPGDVQDALLLAMLEPHDETTVPQRPGQILTPDGALAWTLHTNLAGLGVKVEQREIPGLEELLGELAAQMSGDLAEMQAGQQPRSFLDTASGDEVRNLLQAFGRFMRVRPWQNFTADKPLRASWVNPDGSAGQLYATVMGELGEVHGLALYPDWLNFIKHLNNGFDPELVMLATGGLESLTFSAEDEFAPDDWARLRVVGLPAKAKAGPALMRIGPYGRQVPLTPLRPLIAVLNILSERAERKQGKVTSLKSEQDGVKVQFPATAQGDLSDAEKAGHVVVRLHAGSFSPQPDGGEIVLTGPPELLLRPAFAEARRVLMQQDGRVHIPFNLESSDEFLEDGGFFGDLHVRVWDRGIGSPALTLAHLTRLGLLTDSLGTRVEATLQPGEVGGLRVEWRALPPSSEGSRDRLSN
ncbi:plasmid pRiA4b ORF-3 family protein [Deinococcus rubellus]|uniref:Plasmid pRiA4b ORF-3 family protein n=1 Tax=Deinococcus rubellus TaxID=1889240 RepID=A0ABY5YFU6_9DEIO|nr:plasmid pRiA4b ORF-3 family protein [Deinococcus rubellus]UWX63586.1 plasmid pRiA4b ORF-3 family protein [Deinococcus rubellus]